jgi:hypothetical protein
MNAMNFRPVQHLTNDALVQEARELAANDRHNTGQLLIHLGEIEHRKLVAAAGYPSMYQYCRHEFLMSEDVAYKRIQAARAARKFPRILDGIADGRLNLTTIVLLRKHLTRRNADRLLKEAEHATKTEVQLLIAREFPRPDLPTRIVAIPVTVGPPVARELVPEPVENGPKSAEIGSEAVAQPVVPEFPRVEPLAPMRFGLQVTISQETHDKLRAAQELLSHRIAANDLEGLLDCLVDIALPELQKRKHAATDNPRAQKPRNGNNPRYIPNAVKQAVWERDGGRCTFVSESGHRCESREQIEFDHVDPVARGGTATVRNTRLLCHAHNQYEAEKLFGAGFMENKRRAGAG